MSMRILNRVGVIAVLAGCGGTVGPELSTRREVRCPPGSEDCTTDARCPPGSKDCTTSNGTGVYTAEGGYAGIGTEFKLMITHFMNIRGPRVTFQGRYFDITSNHWGLIEGSVTAADYKTTGGQTIMDQRVMSVGEISTIPTWRIFDVNTGAESTVTDHQLLSLTLHIRFTIPGEINPREVLLGFNVDPIFQDKSTGPVAKPIVHTYNMGWRYNIVGSPMTQYCFRGGVDGSATNPDPVVFQQGIDVNPVNGSVTRSRATAGFVTMSCFTGAPATVYWWGYPYTCGGIPCLQVLGGHPNPTFYFDAGIQMKRASYCGDEHYYTKTGTLIDIADDWPFLQNRPNDVEAFWTPTGASCVNLGSRRHPEMPFSGQCPGKALPACPLLPPVLLPPAVRGPDAYLAEGLR